MPAASPQLSVVVPAHNEAKNLAVLVERLTASLTPFTSAYEIIIVDDHSTDTTRKVALDLATNYPVVVVRNKDKQGKAQALTTGFTAAKYPILGMIDADLTYDTQAFVAMLAAVEQGADVVVANRQSYETTWIRGLASKIYTHLFGKLLHGFECDVQSGLKVFRAEIFERLSNRPTGWNFDLPFLLHAEQAGYSIVAVSTKTTQRLPHSRKSPLQLVGIFVQMMLSAVHLKLKEPEIIRFTPAQIETHGQGFHYKGNRFVPHTTLSQKQSALNRLMRKQSLWMILILVGIGMGLVYTWHTTLVIIVASLTVLYFADLLFNLYLIYRSFYRAPEITVTAEETKTLAPKEWPMYTVLCPLYNEPEVIPQFVSAMSALEYPKDKLQVMLLLEEDDTKTIAQAKKMHLPKYFEIVVVPHSLPKTKPKACNYGLGIAKGEYIVIYDAEDVPDPLQLKKAIIGFTKTSSNAACIQAKLNFYNPQQNILTRVFTAEYSLWFDLVLTGMQSVNAPIPLGGTSNHFKTVTLKKLQGWDGFNVTEDCDLGMRLVKAGYKTAILDSTTLEEANSDMLNWFHQRSRWIKGYIQTYFVHMRSPQDFIFSLHEPHAISFQLIVGGKILSLLINPLMWTITISYFTLRLVVGDFIESLFPTVVFYMAVFSLVFGNFLYLYYYMIGCAKRGHDDIIKYVYLVPFYWLAMSLAAYKGILDLIVAPHRWAKTKHGLHLGSKKGAAQAKEKIGRELVTHGLLVTVPIAEHGMVTEETEAVTQPNPPKVEKTVTHTTHTSTIKIKKLNLDEPLEQLKQIVESHRERQYPRRLDLGEVLAAHAASSHSKAEQNSLEVLVALQRPALRRIVLE